MTPFAFVSTARNAASAEIQPDRIGVPVLSRSKRPTLFASETARTPSPFRSTTIGLVMLAGSTVTMGDRVLLAASPVSDRCRVDSELDRPRETRRPSVLRSDPPITRPVSTDTRCS